MIDVSKFKKAQNITISDCLEFYELNQIKHNIFCKFCKSYNDMTLWNKIYATPNYFVFLLYENENINFILEQKLNLEKFIDSKDKKLPTNYELSGIVFFDKKKNKYNALCVSPIDKNWYLYDDENVQKLDIKSFIFFYNNNNMNTYQICILLYNSINKN